MRCKSALRTRRKEAGSVSAFIDCADGTLTSIGASPFPNCRTAPCSIEISHDGRHLFVVNTESTSISSYSNPSDGSLTLLETTPGPAGAQPIGIAVT